MMKNKILAAVMKKLYLLCVIICFLPACKKSEEFNINIKAPKDYVLFEKADNKLDVENAGTNKYNKETSYAFLLDVSKENDYEKYFPKKYVIGEENNYNLDNDAAKKLDEFLNNGVSINDAYNIISYVYINKEFLTETANFGKYCFPEGSFEKDKIYKNDIRNKCYADFEKGTRFYNKVNLSLLKARNMLLYALDNDLKEESDKIKADAHLMIAVSYIASDELYRLEKIKEHAALWKELGGISVNIFDDDINKKMTSLLTYTAYNENTGVVEILRDSAEKGFMDLVLSKGGIYNYLNDDDYTPVTVMKRGDKYALNPFFIEYENTGIDTYMADIVEPLHKVNNNHYDLQKKYDVLYDNPVYILALNGAVYTVEINNGMPLKAEFRNPAYFRTGYLNREKNNLPKISSEYEYGYIQKDYIKYDNNGKAATVWNGDIREQQPDKSRLFKFRGVVDCLNDTETGTAEICGNRENMIMAKYLYKLKCGGKKDCFVKSSDINGRYMNKNVSENTENTDFDDEPINLYIDKDLLNKYELNEYDEYIDGLNYSRFLSRYDDISDNDFFLREDYTKDDIISLIAGTLAESLRVQHRENWYNIFYLGYKYDDSKSTQLSCSDELLKGSIHKTKDMEIGRTRGLSFQNRQMLKAANFLRDNMENNKDRFYYILSLYLLNGLHNIDELQEKINNLLIENNVTKDDIVSYLLSNIHIIYYADDIANLITVIPDLDAYDPVMSFNKLKDMGLLPYAAFNKGYFDIYNDDFYEMVQIEKFNEFSILTILESKVLDDKYSYLYPRYYKLDMEEQGDSNSYRPQHCTDNVYNGHLYIFPFNNKTYIVNTTETENKITKMEIRSPYFFNTEYEKNYSINAITGKDTEDIKKQKLLHGVSNMGTFSYIDNIVYQKEYDREPQSPLGDVDKAKERRGDKILPEQVKERFNISKFDKKDIMKAVNEYIDYLQEFSSQTLIKNELYFYDISAKKDNPIIIAAAYFYDKKNDITYDGVGIKKEILFIVNNKNLKILDKEAAKEIDKIISDDKYYKSLISNNGDTAFIGFIRSDNNILAVSIIDNKVGYGFFPAYYYKSEKVIIDKVEEISGMILPVLREEAKINCNDGWYQEMLICTNRPLLTAKAYIEKLYKIKSENAYKYFYPNDVIENYEMIYKDFQSLNSCADNMQDKCMESILSYADIFSR